MGRGLGWVTHRGPFQPLLFCDSVIRTLTFESQRLHYQSGARPQQGSDGSGDDAGPVPPGARAADVATACTRVCVCRSSPVSGHLGKEASLALMEKRG